MRTLRFVKSSYSTLEKDCVEVARNLPHAVALRDSKRAEGPVVTVAPAAWDAFTADLRRRP